MILCCLRQARQGSLHHLVVQAYDLCHHLHARCVLAFRSLRNSPCTDNPATYITFQGAGQNRQEQRYPSTNRSNMTRAHALTFAWEDD
jgi:hypothetical protein